MLEVYRLGQRLGNDPQAFSKVGDCQTTLPNFFGDFDNGRYNLGNTLFAGCGGQLFGVIQQEQPGSEGWHDGHGAMATLWNTWKDCNLENPAGMRIPHQPAEFRHHRPWARMTPMAWLPFADTLRRVIEMTLEHGIVPIHLAPKADNAGGTGRSTRPSWNWRMNMKFRVELLASGQPLPERAYAREHHLRRIHLTCDFSTTKTCCTATIRNLTGLQRWMPCAGGLATGRLPGSCPRRFTSCREIIN
jgi:hypothetical protein